MNFAVGVWTEDTVSHVGTYFLTSFVNCCPSDFSLV